MRFRLKQIILFISFLGINVILGQEYFSTFLPVNNYSMDARSMAMGGVSPRSVQDPVFNAFGNPFYISFDVSRRSYTEKRSFPVIDMFEDVVTNNVYVLNRPAFTNVSWTLASDF